VIRDRLAARAAGARPGFRLRGLEVSRVEGFSDAVFGFAVTLLIVSLEVPQTFHELLSVMRGFLPFAISFYLLVQVWYAHYVFFRRYGLQDAPTIVLNCALLFVVLFYVYPLKFLFTLLVDLLTGGRPISGVGQPLEPMIALDQVWLLFVIYGAGFLAVMLIFALLYRHAHARRAELELTALEVFDTRSEIARFALLAGVGLLSIWVALVVSRHQAGLAGFVYFLVGVVEAVHGSLTAKRRGKLQARLADEIPAGGSPPG
jgi:uncharacterized membrane protein